METDKFLPPRLWNALPNSIRSIQSIQPLRNRYPEFWEFLGIPRDGLPPKEERLAIPDSIVILRISAIGKFLHRPAFSVRTMCCHSWAMVNWTGGEERGAELKMHGTNACNKNEERQIKTNSAWESPYCCLDVSRPTKENSIWLLGIWEWRTLLVSPGFPSGEGGRWVLPYIS